MSHLTTEQKIALKELKDAFQHATDSGLLDMMLDDVNDPDSINDVCDTMALYQWQLC